MFLRLNSLAPYLGHTNPLFQSKKILKLNDIYKFKFGVHFFKSMTYENFIVSISQRSINYADPSIRTPLI